MSPGLEGAAEEAGAVPSQLVFEFGGSTAWDLAAFEWGGDIDAARRFRHMLAAGSGHLLIIGPQATGKSHLLIGACAQARGAGVAAVYAPLGELVHGSPTVLSNASPSCSALQVIIEARSGRRSAGSRSMRSTSPLTKR